MELCFVLVPLTNRFLSSMFLQVFSSILKLHHSAFEVYFTFPINQLWRPNSVNSISNNNRGFHLASMELFHLLSGIIPYLDYSILTKWDALLLLEVENTELGLQSRVIGSAISRHYSLQGNLWWTGFEAAIILLQWILVALKYNNRHSHSLNGNTFSQSFQWIR